MPLAVVSRSLSRRICRTGEAAAWSWAGPAKALPNDGGVGRFFSRQIWSKSAAARSPDRVVGFPRSHGAFGAVGGLFPREMISKSAAPGSAWRSSRRLHADARGGSSFVRHHKHILVVISGIVSAIGGTLFLNAFNEVGMIPAQQPTVKEAKNVSAMKINSEEVINNDMEEETREEATINDAETARKKEAAMKAQFEAWMKEHNRRYWTRWEKARRYEFFKANAESIDSWNEKLIREGKSPSYGTNYYSDYSDEEWANMGSPPEDLVEFDKLFGSKSFVTLEDLREINARLEREDKEKRRCLGAWQSIKHWLR